MSAKRSSGLLFALGLALVALSVPLAWWLFLSDPQETVAPPKVVAPAVVDAGPRQMSIRLAEFDGTVEVRRAGTTEWVVAGANEALSPQDGVRTRDGSYAVLVGDEYWEVRMEPGTEVGIGDLSDSISRLLLEKGMAKATVKGGGRHTFEVRSSVGDAVATTDGGVFTMASNGAGTVAVGAESGEVRFVGKGRVVIVKAGQQSVVRPGEAPTTPAAIPSSLLLKVALPARTTVSAPTILVRGRTAVGSHVQVRGQVVTADAQGGFEVKVPLKEGKNPVEVIVRGVGGQSATATHAVVRDTTVKAPTLDPDLWKER